MGLRYEDLYTLTLGEYNIKIEAFQRSCERQYDIARMIMFQSMTGNPHLKKKPKKLSQVFELPLIDGKKAKHLKATLIDRKSAEGIRRLGYKIFESIVGDGEHPKQITS